jgi:hypothetical protein
MKQITITLNEDGRFLVNWGKDTTTVCRSEKEAIIWIKEKLGDLKYYPVGNGIINTNPVDQTTIRARLKYFTAL